MMRLPRFEYHAPRRLAEAAGLLAAHPGRAMILAGGTDILPNMKRRQQTPDVLVSLRNIDELKKVSGTFSTRSNTAKVPDTFSSLGSALTLSELVRMQDLQRDYAGLWQAAAQVATPHLRAMGTLGGNLCLDTRCNYYDQTYEWRKSIDFCMKKDGHICWVATSSPTCLAVSSTDTAPALMALGARVRLVSASGERVVDVSDLYANDGINYLTRRPDEILAEVHLPAADGWRSTYWKLRRRGSFDFPVLSVAAAARLDSAGAVQDARIVLGAVASRPMIAASASDALRGRPLTDESIAEAAGRAYDVAKPMDNTDFALHWRKRVARDFVTYALRELRGDDMRDARRRIARQALMSLSY
jgi:4-hydroxybenzoyl-CoA reductase subunit beta